MTRIVFFLLVGLVVGTVIAWQIPDWQNHIVSPGDVRKLDCSKQPLEITVKDRAADNTYFEFTEKEVPFLEKTSQFSPSANVEVRNGSARFTPATITWTTSTRHSTTTHQAPGIKVDLQGDVAVNDVGDGFAQVTWGGPVWDELARRGSLTVQHGAAKEDHGKLLLTRLEVARRGAERTKLLFLGSLMGGAPLGFFVFILLTIIFAFTTTKVPPREIPARLPAFFPPSYRGVRMNLGIWGGILAFVLLITGSIMLTSENNLINVEGSLHLMAFMTAGAVVLVSVILFFTLRGLRAVNVTENGLEVLSGTSQEPALNASWQELQSVEAKESYRKGSIVDEWLVIKDQAGKKLKINRSHVQDYALLKSLVLPRAPRGLLG